METLQKGRSLQDYDSIFCNGTNTFKGLDAVDPEKYIVVSIDAKRLRTSILNSIINFV